MTRRFAVREAARACSALSAIWSHRRATRDQMRTYQDRRVRQLVAHAYENVPYYRRLFDQHGLRPEHIQGVSDLGAIPISTRSEVQVVPPDDLVARGLDVERLVARTTSGSTGRPFTIRRTWMEDRIYNAFLWRALRGGVAFGDRVVSIQVVHHANRSTPSAPRRPRKRRSWPEPHPVIAIDCRRPPDEIRRKLLEIRPRAIAGLPSTLARVALVLGADDRRVLRPRLVAPFGEVMTPTMRSRIAEGFGAPVLDTYRSHEFTLIAWECQQAGGVLHTSDDALVVEVVQDGRPVAPGERGEVVGTALHSFAMPLIRFRLGDVVTRGSAGCACGRPFGTIAHVQGRMLDYFVLPDGSLLHPYEITTPIIGMAPWIREYQMTQERQDRVVLRVVPFAPPTVEQLAQVRAAMAKPLGPAVAVEVVVVSEIQVEPSGKLRPSRSLVRSEYDGIDWDSRPPTAV